MIKYMWSTEDLEMMKKFINIVETKKHINGTEITNLYNKIFNKTLRPTNCSSCVNQRYKQLKQSFDNYQKELDKLNALIELDALMMDDEEEIKITTKKGRKKKEE